MMVAAQPVAVLIKVSLMRSCAIFGRGSRCGFQIHTSFFLSNPTYFTPSFTHLTPSLGNATKESIEDFYMLFSV